MIDVVIPRWGLTMEEATVSEWLKRVGDAVRANEPICQLETDKATGDVESPADGVLAEIVAEAGTVVPVGGVIGRLCTPEEWAARANAR